MGVRYFHRGGFIVDVRRLVSSSFKRWVAEMDVREVDRSHRHIYNHDDITGDVVIVGGFGVVDGFRSLDQRRAGRIPVIIFELRNAERFIFHELGPREKDGAGLFKPNTLVAQMRNSPDMEGWKRPK